MANSAYAASRTMDMEDLYSAVPFDKYNDFKFSKTFQPL
jgi:hypothetical protein